MSATSVAVSLVPIRCPEKGLVSARDIRFTLVSKGYVPAVATSHNFRELARKLSEKNIQSAYVFGWDDHRKVDDLFVLGSKPIGCGEYNVTVTPFHNIENTASWAFVEAPCPCPEYGVSPAALPYTNVGPASCCPSKLSGYPAQIPSNPSFPTPCAPVYEVRECEERECEREVCRPRRCEERSCSESGSSCSESRVRRRCKSYPRKTKRECEKRTSHGCVNKKVELCRDTKVYTFDLKQLERKCLVVVRVCEKASSSKFQRFLMSRSGRIHGGGKCITKRLPKCLRKPHELYEKKKFAECKLGGKVCLYVKGEKKCHTYVSRCDKFYEVKERRRYGPRKFCLERIKGKRLHKLLRCGLPLVEFDKVPCKDRCE